MAKKRKIIKEIDKSRFKEIKEELEESEEEAEETKGLEQDIHEQETEEFVEFFSGRGAGPGAPILRATQASDEAETAENLEATAATAPADTTKTTTGINIDYSSGDYAETGYGSTRYEVTEADIRANQPREARRLLTPLEAAREGPATIQRVEPQELRNLRQGWQEGGAMEKTVEAEPLEKKYDLPFRQKTKRRTL